MDVARKLAPSREVVRGRPGSEDAQGRVAAPREANEKVGEKNMVRHARDTTEHTRTSIAAAREATEHTQTCRDTQLADAALWLPWKFPFCATTR